MKISSVLFGLAIVFGFALTVSAHVTVKPGEVGVGARQVFTVSVPTEKDIPTVGVRLVVPEGIESVTPNVKPGWFITTKKNGTGEEAKVTEIIWSGGSIPAGQRDEFYFGSKVGPETGALNWKAYQTYRDGTIVAWDVDPNAVAEHDESNEASEEEENTGPYSITNVVDDLAGERKWGKNSVCSGALILSVLALIISIFSLRRSRR